jgi:hypothetical protein
MTTKSNPSFDAEATKRAIRKYRALYRLSWVLNLVLIGLSFYQFMSVGYTLVFDTFFFVINALSVAGFYMTYKTFEVLSFLEHRYNYFTQNHE